MNRLSVLPWACYALFSSATLGFSATKEVDLKRDVRVAKSMVTGEVDRVFSYFGTDGEIYSDVTIRVTASLKQEKESPYSVTFTTPGGIVGDDGVYWTATPQFKRDEAVLVFLEENEKGKLEATSKYELNEKYLPEVSMTPEAFIARIREELDEVGETASESEWQRAALFLAQTQAEQGKKSQEDIQRNVGSAACYRLMGPKWRIPTVNYKLDASLPSSFIPSISAAIASINGAGVPLRLTMSPFSTNVVSFGPIAGSGILAQAGIRYQPSTQTIVSFTVGYNRSFTWSTTGESGKFDVEGIGLHEFGHAIGLHHPEPTSCNDQTMWFSAGPGEIQKRSLEVGDLAGLAAMYGATPPPSAPPPSTPPPSAPSTPPGQAPPVPVFSSLSLSGNQVTSSPIVLSPAGTSFLTDALQFVIRGAGCPTSTGCVIDTRSLSGLTTTAARAVFVSRGAGVFTVNLRNSAVGRESSASFRFNVAVTTRR